MKSAPTTPIANSTVALDTLAPHPRNYRSHPADQIRKLASSLRRFGQVRSIVVQEQSPNHYLIVAGHGIVDAAKQLHWQTLRADVLPSSWTESQVEGYLVADNLHVLGADDDLVVLTQLLQEQAQSGDDLSSVGSSFADLNDLLAQLQEEDTGTPEYAPPPMPPISDDIPGRIRREVPSYLQQQTEPDREGDLFEGDDGDVPSSSPFHGSTLGRTAPQEDGQPSDASLVTYGEQGHYPGTTREGRIQTYNASLIRQIVLIMNQDEYLWAVQSLKNLMAHYHAKNHTELIFLLIRDAVSQLTAPAAIKQLPEPEAAEE
jgi:ParB-like nuclease family protein